MDTNQNTQPVTPEMQTSPKKSKWKIIVLLAVIGIAALIFAAVKSVQGATKAADAFVADIQAGRCSEVYERSTEQFKSQGTVENWEQACAIVSDILQGDPTQAGIEIESNSGQDQVSVVSYEIQGTDGVRYGVAIGMVNQDGEWKITLFDSDPLEDGEEV